MTALTAGSPEYLGARIDGAGVNFCLFSAHAERVVLCVFDEQGGEQQWELPGRSGDRWHGHLAGAGAGLRYGFRLHGPFDPGEGHRFNPAKLVIDPCAYALEGEVGDHPALLDAGDRPDPTDSAPYVPKCRVVALDYDWHGDTPPAVPWGKTVIYEAHVRGLTQLHPAIPAALRGTYAGLAHPQMLAYLRSLGITAVELLPVQQHAHEPRLQRQGLSNYWGYNVLAPCAVEPAYAAGQQGQSALNEFRDMVRALHGAGIEVLLDVVFNHSAELDRFGPVLSLRAIDNRSYYWLDEQGDYRNWTGCGNTLRLCQPLVREWVMTCLRFWVEECHVDGFRFDLGSVLGRTPAFSADAPLFAAIKADPLLGRCKLIAEPWDIGPDGYQAGRFPSPFAEWNDRFRDDVRRFWLHGDIRLGQFARRFAASVNMLTAHDGFTLRDLVSFNHKHNQANGEDNRDGAGENHSFNHGHEGLDASAQVNADRGQSQRSLLTTLLLSQGTPMLMAGDEHGHNQQGNNNAYCQDNATTWLDWAQADEALTAFTAGLIRLRQSIPALNVDRWWVEDSPEQVEWLDEHGAPLCAEQWQQGEKRLQIRLSQRTLFVINATTSPCEITLPEGRWRLTAPFQPLMSAPADLLLSLGPRAACVLEQD